MSLSLATLCRESLTFVSASLFDANGDLFLDHRGGKLAESERIPQPGRDDATDPPTSAGMCAQMRQISVVCWNSSVGAEIGSTPLRKDFSFLGLRLAGSSKSYC